MIARSIFQKLSGVLAIIMVALFDGPVVTIDGVPVEGISKIEITTTESVKSPTGREPRILWSPRWQVRWQQAAAEDHPWHEWLEFAVANPDSAYFDKELFPVVLFQITGDPAYARQAWTRLSERIDKGVPSQDVIRANWLEWLVAYEWLYPALTDAERSQFAIWSGLIAGAVAATPLADSDRLVTAYFGLRVDAALFGRGPLNMTAGEERLVEYARLSEGGEWVEGTAYNDGTTATIMLGTRACEDLKLEVPAALTGLQQQFAAATRHRWDNTLSHRLTWGATQTANVPRTGINRGDLVMDSWAAAGLHDMIARAQTKAADESGRYWARPHAVAYLFYNPYFKEPPQRGPAPTPTHLLCPGQQLLFARSTWDGPGETLVMFRCGRFNGAHHPTADGGDFTVLRRGEWVVARPRAYSDSLNVDGLGANNSLLLGNQPLNFTRREMLGAGEAGGCYWMIQEHGGPWQHGNVRTAEYVHSAKRWLVWVSGEVDVVLVRDVIDVSQPPDQRADRKTYNIGAAHQRHIDYVASQETGSPIPLVQVVFHMQVQPESELTWRTPGGQSCQLHTLRPGKVSIEFVDEAEHYGPGVDVKELGWQTRISPTWFSGGKIELLHAVTVGGDADVEVVGDAVRVGRRVVSFLESTVEVVEVE